MLDYFQFYLLPLSIRIGMSPRQFWNGDPDLFWAYWDAYEENQKQRAREENANAFNLGQYILLALGQTLQFTKHPKQIYPKKPLPLGIDKQVELTPEEYQEIRKVQMMSLTKRFNSQQNN